VRESLQAGKWMAHATTMAIAVAAIVQHNKGISVAQPVAADQAKV